MICKLKLGPSISSPVLTDDKLIFAGYNGLWLFNYSREMVFTKIGKFAAEFEASPVIMNGRIYIASRNGYLYCFGD